MKFKYQGFDRTARKVAGELDAASEFEAQKILRSQGIRPTRMSGGGGGTTSGPSRPSSSSSQPFSLNSIFSQSPTPTLMEFTAFIRQFATMQQAGIPIVQGLQILGEQSDNRAFGNAISQVARSIEGGTGLTDALRKYPKVFDRVFINLVAAGEISGSLDKVLQRLATYYEKSAALRRKIKSAMTYPTLILVLVIGVVIVMMMFVVPTFQQMFAGNKAQLPYATQLIVKASNGFRQYWYLVFGGIGALIFGIYYSLTNEDVRKQLDPFLLRMPIFGPLFMKVAIARFSRTLGTMIQSGVPILDALDITARVAGNYAIETAINRTRQSISEGNSIADPLQRAKVFPKMAVSMIAVGEQTGALDQMLNKIAEFYEDEVDAAVSSITSILEPLMIVVVGAVVAGILIPMYLPIFKMGDVIGGQ